MRTLLLSLFAIFVIGNCNAQKKKVKGNKIVMTEEKIVDAFHTVEVYDNFEVAINEDSDPIVKVEADSNLQEFIDVTVQDSILKIKATRDLRRAKALNITISYASELKKIKIYDKVNLKSLVLIKSSELTVETNDNSEAFLSLETGKITAITNGKSNIDLHTDSEEAFYQVNENSELKGIIKADSLKIDLYQKGYAKLEGDVKSMLVRADGDTDFYGEKLTSITASIIAEGSSDCYLLTNEEITIEAKDETEIYLLGEPKINMTLFTNEATLYKKKIDYSPGILRLK
ncbi:GIN domain-containing protein [Aquimarina sp. SS2-1]|uniref:GIN domain-containing protein n=1 Tax=Aquimarina besae TaxID=3342247 RepID=UPI003672DC14